MCGRFTLFVDPRDLMAAFPGFEVPLDWTPRYNIAPSQPVAVIPNTGENRIVPVPYDFDWSGVVNARYAKPAPEIGTRSVRERVYRGVCRPDVDYAAHYAALLSHREEMTALIRGQEGLNDDEQRETLEYLDEAWLIFQRPDRARDRIEEACRPV